MDEDKMRDVYAEFADMAQEMLIDFMEIFHKYLKKNQRATILMSVQLPINLIMNLLDRDSDNVLPEIFPEFPDMFHRFCYPFAMLKDSWGKVSNEEFCKRYREIYEAQFDEWVISPEDRANFGKFFDGMKES